MQPNYHPSPPHRHSNSWHPRSSGFADGLSWRLLAKVREPWFLFATTPTSAHAATTIAKIIPNTNQFVISEEYEHHVRERISLFREKTKTSKSLVSTFITTFGVANGMHRSIVGKEVVAKDLFS